MSNSSGDLRDEAVRLYLDEKMTVREIAERFGCSYCKIYNALRGRVVMRNPGPVRRPGNYLKIAETIRDRIIDGEWNPGYRIPSQLELRWTFNVANSVVLNAIAHLRVRGYLLTRPGSGTFVQPKECWEQDDSDW